MPSSRSATRALGVTGAKEPGPRGGHGVSRKPLRREGRLFGFVPVVPAPCIFVRTGAMGAASTRPSLRPLNREGESFAKLGHAGVARPHRRANPGVKRPDVEMRKGKRGCARSLPPSHTHSHGRCRSHSVPRRPSQGPGFGAKRAANAAPFGTPLAVFRLKAASRRHFFQESPS
jgi:hypothetical protein